MYISRYSRSFDATKRSIYNGLYVAHELPWNSVCCGINLRIFWWEKRLNEEEIIWSKEPYDGKREKRVARESHSGHLPNWQTLAIQVSEKFVDKRKGRRRRERVSLIINQFLHQLQLSEYS